MAEGNLCDAAHNCQGFPERNAQDGQKERRHHEKHLQDDSNESTDTPQGRRKPKRSNRKGVKTRHREQSRPANLLGQLNKVSLNQISALVMEQSRETPWISENC